MYFVYFKRQVQEVRLDPNAVSHSQRSFIDHFKLVLINRKIR